MNNSNHKAKNFSVALLVALLAVSTSFASVMTGCGSKSESSAASATVADTSAANAKNTTVANDKSESEVTSESSNSQSSGSESKSESAQSSEKSESSGSSDSGNNSGNKSNNNSSDKNNSDEKSNEDVTLDLKKGQTVTVTYSVKSTVVLTNYQAKITYDSSKLKVKTAQLQKPATSNGVINAKVAGQINFNGSDISMGYDYTKGGELVVVTFEATSDGSSKVDWLWQSASTLDDKNNIVLHIDDNGKSDGTVTLSTSYK